MIKKVIKFVDTDYKWQDHEKVEDAKNAAKRRLIQKFVTEHQFAPDVSWRYTWDGFSSKIRDAKRKGYQDGWYGGQQATEDRLIKFLPEITEALKKIDEQPIEEVKNG